MAQNTLREQLKPSTTAKPTNSKRDRFEVSCDYCGRITVNSTNIDASDWSRPAQMTKKHFCEVKCKFLWVKKYPHFFLSSTLENVFQVGTELDSPDYQEVSVHHELRYFYNQVFSIFHSKVFQEHLKTVPGFLDSLRQTNYPEIDIDRMLGQDKQDAASLQAGMHLILGNLLALVKSPDAQMCRPNGSGVNPAIETFAFIHNLLVRLSSQPQSADSEEPNFRVPHEQSQPKLSTSQRVWEGLLTLYADVCEQQQTAISQDSTNTPKDRPDQCIASPVEGVDAEAAQYSASGDQESGDSEYHGSQSQEFTLAEKFAEEIEHNEDIVGLELFTGKKSQLDGLSDFYSPHFRRVLISNPGNLGSVCSLQVHSWDAIYEFSILSNEITQNGLNLRRIRTLLDEFISFPFKFTSRDSSRFVKLLDEKKPIWFRYQGEEITLELAKLCMVDSQNKDSSKLGAYAISHIPSASLILIKVKYLMEIEYQASTASKGYYNSARRDILVNERYVAIQESSLERFLESAGYEEHQEVKDLDDQVKRKLSKAYRNLVIHDSPVQIEESQGERLVVLKRRVSGNLISQAGLTISVPVASNPPQVREYILSEKISEIMTNPKITLYFDYELEELLQLLLGPEELEKLQQDVVEKKGPPTVLMIQFEKGMQLPMLGYYFLRAFSAGENLFSYGLPANKHLALSSFTIHPKNGQQEVFLNLSSDTQIYDKSSERKRVDLFSSLQGRLANQPLSVLEPEWITQIIYELQEKPKTAAP